MKHFPDNFLDCSGDIPGHEGESVLASLARRNSEYSTGVIKGIVRVNSTGVGEHGAAISVECVRCVRGQLKARGVSKIFLSLYL